MQVAKTFDTVKQAAKFQDRLYDQYDHVRLVKSPIFSQQGQYVWDVRHPVKPADNRQR